MTAPRQASHTALGTAYLRAAHQLLDAPPRILEDPVAVPLLGNGAARRIHGESERYRQPQTIALRTHVVLRSRFAEDRLAAAVRRGVACYVILGAGFDTFALRQPPWAQGLKILEVDQPETQAMKRRFLAHAGLEMPANASFAQVDFERESLLDGLRRNHLSPDEPVFFSWLGVTMYLQEAAIDAALNSMAAFAPGSEVVLTFLPPPDAASAGALAESRQLASRVAGVGEPFVSFFEPEAIQATLTAAGFGKITFLTLENAAKKYFSSQPPVLPLPRRINIVSGIRQETV